MKLILLSVCTAFSLLCAATGAAADARAAKADRGRAPAKGSRETKEGSPDAGDHARKGKRSRRQRPSLHSRRQLRFGTDGKRTSAFETVFSNDIEMFRPDKIKQFDAVCFNNTQGVLWDDPELKVAARLRTRRARSRRVPRRDFDLRSTPGIRSVAAIRPHAGGTENGGHPWGPEDTYTFKVDDPKSPLTAMFHGQGFALTDEVDQLQEPARGSICTCC